MANPSPKSNHKAYNNTLFTKPQQLKAVQEEIKTSLYKIDET